MPYERVEMKIGPPYVNDMAYQIASRPIGSPSATGTIHHHRSIKQVKTATLHITLVLVHLIGTFRGTCVKVRINITRVPPTRDLRRLATMLTAGGV
jgi:hypothetical protein